MLLFCTGSGDSECALTDVEDRISKNNGIKALEKAEMKCGCILCPCRKALKKYLEVRENITPLAGHEHALYSTQRRRIGVQAYREFNKNMPGRSQLQKKIILACFAKTYGTALY